MKHVTYPAFETSYHRNIQLIMIIFIPQNSYYSRAALD